MQALIQAAVDLPSQMDPDAYPARKPARPRILVVGGGDVGSAVAHTLFRHGAQVLIAERERSPHARRGMAFTDALFDGEASLEGVLARYVKDVAGVSGCWQQGHCIPVVTLPENLLTSAIAFDALVEATMRRDPVRQDLRGTAGHVIGLGPGYEPGSNCDIAIETQWGDAMGTVLRDRAAAPRSGGPRALDGVTRERFVPAESAGLWRSSAQLGQRVRPGDIVGHLDGRPVRAPIHGHLRGVSRDGVRVAIGARLLEVDPRQQPELAGLGERPVAIARGVLQALSERLPALEQH